MNLASAFTLLRNRTGAISTVDSLPGFVASVLAVWLVGKTGITLSDTEIAAVAAAGPVISSHAVGTVRHVYSDIMTAFQRGISNP